MNRTIPFSCISSSTPALTNLFMALNSNMGDDHQAANSLTRRSEAYVPFAFSPFLAAVKITSRLPLPPSPHATSGSLLQPLIHTCNGKTKIHRKSDVGASSGALFQICIECGKRFSSPKALYGHMRCHPDRPYRGMSPRSHFTRPLQLLGPRAVQPKFTEEEYEVAMSLLLLSKSTSHGKEIIEEGSLCSGYVGKKRSWKKEFRKRSRYLVEENERSRSCCCSDIRTCVWDLNLAPPLEE